MKIQIPNIMDNKIDPNCPNYETCTVRDDCARERCCMNADYWKILWMRKSRIRPKLDMPPGRDLTNAKAICCYCEKEIIYQNDLTVEHLIPKSFGGNNIRENKRPCCSSCNNDRGNDSLTMWILRMQQRLSRATEGSLFAPVLLIRIKNAQFWIHYIESAGPKLYRNEELYNKRRLLI